MRGLTLVFFAGCLLLLGLLYRSHLPASYALVGVALVGLNPGVQTLAGEVMSDIPFLFFLLAALVAIDKRRTEESLSRSLITGVLLFVAFSIRTVGGLTAAALMLASMRRSGRVDRSTTVSLGCFAVLATALTLWNSGPTSYMDQFNPSFSVLVSNTLKYAQDFSSLWDTGLDRLAVGEWFRKGFTLFAIAAIVVGFLSRVRRGPTTMEFFVVLYVLMILAWPAYQGSRFVVPVLPMFFLYLLLGAQILADRARSELLARATLVAAAVAPFFIYVSFYAFQPHPTERFEVTGSSSMALFEFLRETPEEAVFVNAKPRVLSLMTGRHAVANHEPATDREMMDFLEEVGATHVVLGPEALGRREYLDDFLRRNGSAFLSVFANESFEVFQARE